MDALQRVALLERNFLTLAVINRIAVTVTFVALLDSQMDKLVLVLLLKCGIGDLSRAQPVRASLMFGVNKWASLIRLPLLLIVSLPVDRVLLHLSHVLAVVHLTQLPQVALATQLLQAGQVGPTRPARHNDLVDAFPVALHLLHLRFELT